MPVFLLLVMWGLGPFTATASAQGTAINRDQAVSLVTQTQLGGSYDGVRLFVHPQLLPAGQSVSDWKKELFVTPAAGWFVFVDRNPGANWEHPCWYFFVDAASGDVRRFDASAPPQLQPQLAEITSGRDNPAPGISEKSLADFSDRLSRLPKPPPARGQADRKSVG